MTFSLPTQRCFLDTKLSAKISQLFSAYAEVFPAGVKKGDTIEPFLCLRRGVSIVAPFPAGTDYFSLPTQRCFSGYCSGGERRELFSAYAEVFLKSPKISLRVHSFLCLRRGVSVMPPGLFLFFTFSLPTQRCFPDIKQLFLQPILFSAYAEMFPSTQSEQSDVWAFLCLHRGVS